MQRKIFWVPYNASPKEKNLVRSIDRLEQKPPVSSKKPVILPLFYFLNNCISTLLLTCVFIASFNETDETGNAESNKGDGIVRILGFLNWISRSSRRRLYKCRKARLLFDTKLAIYARESKGG